MRISDTNTKPTSKPKTRTRASRPTNTDASTGNVRIEGTSAYITLAHGKETIIDAKDLPLLQGWTVVYHNRGYAALQTNRNGEFVQKLLHRHILSLSPRDPHIDHQSGDKLDNRSSNLRHATKSQNASNQGLHANSTTGVKGVSAVLTRYSKPVYMASITIDGKNIFLGSFNTAEDAGRTYDDAALRYHKSYARTNLMLGLLDYDPWSPLPKRNPRGRRPRQR